MATRESAAPKPGDHIALEKKIRASVDTQKPVKARLATNQRIITRVTDGIYREPWAAFRELIANAYDADATYVTIETGMPDFEQIVVRDDGIGMLPQTLAYILTNIGGSSKRTAIGAGLHTAQEADPNKSPGGRPLIGKIGIGLFAVAQLTQHFQIITKAAKDQVRTSATVRLKTHDEANLESLEGKYIAGDVVIKSESVPSSEIDAHGTTIVLYSLRPEVRHSLQSTRRWHAILPETSDGGEFVREEEPTYHIGFSPPSNSDSSRERLPSLPWGPSDTPEDKFEMLFQAASELSGKGRKSADLEHFDEYLRLVWKLSLSLPVNYISEHPFDADGTSGLIFYTIPDEAKQASELDLPKGETLRNHLDLQAGSDTMLNEFSVVLDGIALQRPIRLPSSLVKSSRIKAPVLLVAKQDNPFAEEDLERAGGPLSFEGYLYWNSKIVPKETAGVLIRVRDASGTLFDSTFLKYQVSEQTRLRQITAEIFVHDGLDSAINIDRESFNYSHPHFLYIQRWLHKALRLLVNRLKALSTEDLQREKARHAKKVQTTLFTHAESVWSRQRGKDADPPLQDSQQEGVPEDVGGVEIEWPSAEIPIEPDKADKTKALSVVLEAYGVLSNLSVRDRARLIKDILNIFNFDK